ncbi:MAG: hypothetical protein OEQ28_11925, partial [Acidobacteriota bacterium]|nr:hypothetical protein [Acidobacteriota bacterium]
MKFIRYSKFRGFDVAGVDLGDLMDALSDLVLDSGFHQDYWYTRQRSPVDDSLDGLRQALLKALLENGVLDELDVRKMLADNDDKFRGSLLEELINNLIERLVEEGYLDLKELESGAEQKPGNRSAASTGEPSARDVRFK